MKIGLVCPYSLFSPGGVKEHALALYREFKKKGHQVKVIAPKTKPSPNPDLLLLGRSMRFPFVTGSWGRISACFENQKIEELLKRENFDLVHFHEPIVPFLPWQLLFASRTVNVATLHAAWENGVSTLANFEFLTKFFSENFETRLDGLITVSQTAKKCWQQFFQKEISVIPNGIDLARFNPQVKPIAKYQDNKINILFVGRLERRKGAIYLLRAFKKMAKQNLRLILVGSGPRKIELELFTRAYDLLDVELVSKASESLLPRYYASADVCCFPSIGGESFGIVLLEAMASAKPVVCFANPGYAEVLKDYPFKKGLVKVKDVGGLSRALTTLSQDKALREKLGRWGRREAQKYSWPKVASQVLKYYQANG